MPEIAALVGGWAIHSEASGEVPLEVTAEIAESDWGIVQSPFMRDQARTLEFRHNVRLAGDTLTYQRRNCRRDLWQDA